MQSLQAQRIYVNTSDMVYELTYSNGREQMERVSQLCNISASRTIFSMAIHQDTLYYNSGKNLFRVVPGQPGTCQRILVLPGTAPTYNCMTADKFGNILTIEYNSRTLYRYDPVNKRLDSLGKLPSAPAGDLMFYKGILLYATISDGIFEIDLENPSRSKQFMATPGYSFYGLLSFPFDCKSNKVYGISLHATGTGTDLIELDLDKRVILSKYNTLPYPLYDAASSVDNGTTMGISIDAVELQLAGCNSTKGSDIHFKAFTAVPGSVNYLMDGTISNKDGKFTNLSAGPHTLTLTNSKGCTYDTVFTITPLKDATPDVTIKTVDQKCSAFTGSLEFNVSGNNAPFELNFNGEGFKPHFNFDKLNAGKYPVTIRNKNYCTWDTFAIVKNACDTLFMPNAFTPNGDGTNDLIRPVFSQGMGDVLFSVYNRFGQKIYESTGPTKGWDGKIGGSPQPSGSYAYLIRYKSNVGAPKIQKGTFMLIR